MVLHAPTIAGLQTLLDLLTLYTTQRQQYVCWSDQGRHKVGTPEELGAEIWTLVIEDEFSHTCVMTADCRNDRDIEKAIHEAKCSWQYTDQEVLIYNCKNPIFQLLKKIQLLSNLWMFFLASVPTLY